MTEPEPGGVSVGGMLKVEAVLEIRDADGNLVSSPIVVFDNLTAEQVAALTEGQTP